MPDGDIVRGGLRRLYQKPYEALSEGKATLDECTRSLLKSLKKDIQGKGNLPIMLAKNMGEILTNAIDDSGGIIFTDWTTLRQEFNSLVRQADGSPRVKELVLRASRRVLHDLQYGGEVDISCSSKEILFRYMIEVYESEFRESIPTDAEKSIFGCLEKMDPKVISAIDKWSEKADETGMFEKLRLPLLQEKREINLDEDLLSGHNIINLERLITL